MRPGREASPTFPTGREAHEGASWRSAREGGACSCHTPRRDRFARAASAFRFTLGCARPAGAAPTSFPSVESRTGAVAEGAGELPLPAAFAVCRCLVPVPDPVSRPRSSNRTCGFPASGSPTGLSCRGTRGVGSTKESLEPVDPEFSVHPFIGEQAGASRGHLVALL